MYHGQRPRHLACYATNARNVVPLGVHLGGPFNRGGAPGHLERPAPSGAGLSYLSSHAREGFGRSAQRGWTTIAEPPPRRTVSAAASKRLPPRLRIAVTAPISPASLRTCPRPRSPAAAGLARNAGSASSAAPLREDRRGAAMASTSERSRSR